MMGLWGLLCAGHSSAAPPAPGLPSLTSPNTTRRVLYHFHSADRGTQGQRGPWARSQRGQEPEPPRGLTLTFLTDRGAPSLQAGCPNN